MSVVQMHFGRKGAVTTLLFLLMVTSALAADAPNDRFEKVVDYWRATNFWKGRPDFREEAYPTGKTVSGLVFFGPPDVTEVFWGFCSARLRVCQAYFTDERNVVVLETMSPVRRGESELHAYRRFAASSFVTWQPEDHDQELGPGSPKLTLIADAKITFPSLGEPPLRPPLDNAVLECIQATSAELYGPDLKRLVVSRLGYGMRVAVLITSIVEGKSVDEVAFFNETPGFGCSLPTDGFVHREVPTRQLVNGIWSHAHVVLVGEEK